MNKNSSLPKFALSLVVILIVVLAVQIGIEKSHQESEVPLQIDTAAAEAKQESLVLFARPDSYKQGSADSKVTLVLFGDYQSQASLAAHEIVKKVLADYGSDIYYVYHHFPLENNNYARVAAEASEIAGFSGKFWEMSDLLYANQASWAKTNDFAVVVEMFSDYAETLGLDPKVFREELLSGKYTHVVKADEKDAAAFDIENAPAIFVNGVQFSMQLTYENLKEVVESELK